MHQNKVNQRYAKIPKQDEHDLANDLFETEGQRQSQSGIYPEQLTQQQKLDLKISKAKDWLILIKEKAEALAWVLAAAAVIYYSNFFLNLFNHPNRNLFFFNVSMFFLAINVTLAIYASIVIPYILKVKQSLDDYAPRVIYAGAICGFICFLSIVIACWPIWGWLILPMLFVLFLGYLSTAAFLPNNSFGSILLGVIFFLMYFTQHYIQHEGYWHYDAGGDDSLGLTKTLSDQVIKQITDENM